MSFYIKKTSGEKEYFNLKKLHNSLQAAGAETHIIEKIIEEIKQRKPRSTRAIHKLTTQILSQTQPALAARYNIKNALMELGPAGFPFEQFVAEIFKAQGFKVQTGTIIQGKCVDHEIDVVAEKDNTHYIIETKFHNSPGLTTDVKVTLYIQARFEDIKATWNNNAKDKHLFHQGWVATNTRFTSQAIIYGSCVNLNLLGWKYPHNEGIAELINSFGLHPITSLTTLTTAEKKQFIRQGLVLCKDVQNNTNLLKQIGFSPHRIKKLVAESQAVCQI